MTKQGCKVWEELEQCPRIKNGNCAPAYKSSNAEAPKCRGAGMAKYDGFSNCSEWHGKWRKALNYNECEIVKELNEPYPQHRKKPSELHEHIIKLLAKTRTILDKHNITWWVEYSTALAALRDGQIFPHDSDADIAIMADCREEVKAILLDELPAIGGWLELDFETRDPPELEMTIRLNETEGPIKIKVDVYVYTLTDKGCMKMTGNPNWQKRHLKMPEWAPHPDSWVFPLRPCHIEGIGELPCPNQNAKRTKFWYGYIGAGSNTCSEGIYPGVGKLCERISEPIGASTPRSVT